MANVIDRKAEVSIMVCGKSGIGKSTLLNILMGTTGKFSETGPGDDQDDSMDAGTKEIISQSETIHGIKVTMYDTPGFQSDPSDNYFVDSMDKIKALVKGKIDLVLFCIDGGTVRWTHEAETVKTLHSCFGNELWMNAIFVLTKSNIAQPGKVEKEPTQNGKVAICEKAANRIFNNFKEELLKQNASAEVVKRIPLVATGSDISRILIFVAPGVYNEDFLPEIWSQAVKQCRKESTVPFFIVSNYKQGRFVVQRDDLLCLTSADQAEVRRLLPDEYPAISDSSSTPSLETAGLPQSQPIVLSKKQSNRVYKALGAVFGGVIGSAATGTVTGIGVGALVWGTTALTMVAAGPVGVGVGVGVGALIGMGVLTGLLIYQIKKSKEKAKKENFAENDENKVASKS